MNAPTYTPRDERCKPIARRGENRDRPERRSIFKDTKVIKNIVGCGSRDNAAKGDRGGMRSLGFDSLLPT